MKLHVVLATIMVTTPGEILYSPGLRNALKAIPKLNHYLLKQVDLACQGYPNLKPKKKKENFGPHTLRLTIGMIWKNAMILSRGPNSNPYHSVSLRLDPGLLDKIRVIAHKRGLSYNALIRYLLSKGIERELKES